MDLSTTLKIGVAVVAIAAAVPFLLPREVSVERSEILQVAPADVLELAASNAGYQTFNPYLTADPALEITHFGPARGVGSGFRFDGKDGTGSQTVAAVSDTEVRYAIDLGPMGQPTQVIRVEPVDGGTKVTWRMESDMGMNPIGRVIGLFLDRMVGGTFEQGLANIGRVAA